MKGFYIQLGQNGYGFDQVKGYTLRNLLDDIGFDYDEAENDNEMLLNSEVFAKTDGRYGANYYSIQGAYEIDEDDEE